MEQINIHSLLLSCIFNEVQLKLLLKTIKIIFVISATIHMAILIPHSLLTGNIEGLNFFKILDIELLFPDVATGTSKLVLSLVVFVIFFYTVYLFVSRNSIKNDDLN